MGYDFDEINRRLARSAENLLHEWLPGGKIVGREFMCGSVAGEKGKSLKFNLDKLCGEDFATGQKFGDLIDLYAAACSIPLADAAKILAEKSGTVPVDSKPLPAKRKTLTVRPPQYIDQPTLPRNASATWTYRDTDGSVMFYISRIDSEGHRKKFIPTSWNGTSWEHMLRMDKRPLYGLELLIKRPNDPVMIVEGEKACEAARRICGKVYVVITWPGGASAVESADWSPIYGRKNILIWPDADGPGQIAAKKIAELIVSHCETVKIIYDENKPQGWDAADALGCLWDWDSFAAWAKPLAIVAKNGTPPPEEPKTLNVEVRALDDIEIDSSLAIIVEELGLVASRGGKPVCNMGNVINVLERLPGFAERDVCWYDEFYNRIFTEIDGPAREWNDDDNLDILKLLQNKMCFTGLTPSSVGDGIRLYAKKRMRNEPRDWMETLHWDGTERIAGYFSTYIGAQDKEYTRACGKNFWIGMVARILRPGCKLDNMVVMRGGQGTFKTTSLEIIGGPWYTEASESVTSKDFYVSMQGKMLIEIGELGSFSKADTQIIKQVLTRRVDRYREPYARLAIDHPRMSMFVGTTNLDRPLRDETGARRFWPILVGKIDLKAIERDREQLFAEAVEKFKAGEDWFRTPEEETADIHEIHREHDEWEEIIFLWLSRNTDDPYADPLTTARIAESAIKLDTGKLGWNEQRRIGNAMHHLGYERTYKREGKNMRRVWVKKGSQLPA